MYAISYLELLRNLYAYWNEPLEFGDELSNCICARNRSLNHVFCDCRKMPKLLGIITKKKKKNNVIVNDSKL